MNQSNFEEILKLREEKSEFIKYWIILGFFGAHKFKQGKHILGFIYVVLNLLSILFTIYGIGEMLKLDTDLEFKIELFYPFFISFFLVILITIWWIVDFMLYVSKVDVKIKNLQ